MTDEQLVTQMREMAGWCAEAFGFRNDPAGRLSGLLANAADRLEYAGRLSGLLANAADRLEYAGRLSGLLANAADRLEYLVKELADEQDWHHDAMARLEQLTGRVDL